MTRSEALEKRRRLAPAVVSENPLTVRFRFRR